MKNDLTKDPRLTAYVLGELDPQDRKELEMQINKDPHAKKMVEELKKTANIVTHELSQDNQEKLESDRLANIKTQVSGSTPISRFGIGKLLKILIPVAAGCIVFILVFSPDILDKTNKHYQNKNSPTPATPQEEAVLGGLANSVSKTISEKLESSSTQIFGKAGGLVNDISPSSGNRGTLARTQGFVKAKRKSMAMDSRPDVMPRPRPPVMIGDVTHNTETYDHIEVNNWYRVKDAPLSTFSIDVDTASYANLRRFLMRGILPPKDAVRIEEMINYFSYSYEPPKKDAPHPFAVHIEQSNSPWNKKYQLVKIGLKGKVMDRNARPSSNLVFLLDVSGSMNSPNKLPLLVQAIKMLVAKLGENDRVAIVVYAGATGVVLNSTAATNKVDIYRALSQLQAGGSTNGEAGLQNAYALAKQNFIPGGVNRVILATDGDFNVGNTSRGEMVRFIQKAAKGNIFLTVLGFGMGNYKDAMLEEISGKGNGNYFYIDTLNEAKKVLVNDLSSTLVTIAKDVKIQVEFNPTLVAGYRLIGYENRMLKAQDFNDDKKDAGEIGAGHTVTALYEIIPAGMKVDVPEVDELKYQKKAPSESNNGNELLTVKLRYKEPTEEKSKLMVYPWKNQKQKFEQASEDFRFAAAVASFGMLLREDRLSGDVSYSDVIKMAKDSKGKDTFGYREEMIELVELARSIKKRN